VHDEVLDILKREPINQDMLNSLIHKVKGGAQLLGSHRFVRCCEDLEQEDSHTQKISSFQSLLAEQNEQIIRYQKRYAAI
jgi:two-component system sensor histidine kinase EvgS